MIWHECEHLLPQSFTDIVSYTLAGNSIITNSASFMSISCTRMLPRDSVHATKHHEAVHYHLLPLDGASNTELQQWCDNTQALA